MTTTLGQSGLGSGKKFKRLKLLIYGPFGTWKTVNAHHLPNTRTLDVDDGLQSVEWAIRAGKLVRPNWDDTWSLQDRLNDIVHTTITPPASMDESQNKVFDQCADQIEAWLREEDIPPEEWEERCFNAHGVVYRQHWDTLILDSGTALGDATILKALRETDRLDLSKSWEKRTKHGLTPRMIQDYGAAGILFEKFMTLCYGTGKNLILICHEYNSTTKAGALLAVEPLLTGRLRQSVPKDFDEVWYAKVKGTAAESRGIFQTQPDPMHRCRSRLGCLDHEETADFSAIRAKVAKFYEVPEDTIWVAPHGSEAALELAKEDAAEQVAI